MVNKIERVHFIAYRQPEPIYPKRRKPVKRSFAEILKEVIKEKE